MKFLTKSGTEYKISEVGVNEEIICVLQDQPGELTIENPYRRFGEAIISLTMLKNSKEWFTCSCNHKKFGDIEVLCTDVSILVDKFNPITSGKYLHFHGIMLKDGKPCIDDDGIVEMACFNTSIIQSLDEEEFLSHLERNSEIFHYYPMGKIS